MIFKPHLNISSQLECLFCCINFSHFQLIFFLWNRQNLAQRFYGCRTFNFLKPGTINALNSRVRENWEIGEIYQRKLDGRLKNSPKEKKIATQIYQNLNNFKFMYMNLIFMGDSSLFHDSLG